MKLVIEVDGYESTRYKYNLWSTNEWGEENARIELSDDLEDFITKLRHQLKSADEANYKKHLLWKQERCSNGELEPCNCAMH